jgi:predicted GH43/DUF377 family glycosyl hydrolase
MPSERRLYMRPKRKIGPLFKTHLFKEIKDPCILHDGKIWHIYGTAVPKLTGGLSIFHATAPNPEGPWVEMRSAHLDRIKTPHIAAPGVIYDQIDGHFHMSLQEDFTSLGGKIDYFASADGHKFTFVSTILEPIPHSSESGLYDPHFFSLENEKYLVYAGMPTYIDRSKPFIPQPDIYLAKSETGLWIGPWERLGKILDHDDIHWHHNKRDHPDYEWGIEGPQIVELPNGKFLLNATCFLGTGKRGHRQRVFFAIADTVTGPYRTLGPVLNENLEPWESGENGHATVHLDTEKEILYLFYQARPGTEENNIGLWNYGIAVFDLNDLK